MKRGIAMLCILCLVFVFLSSASEKTSADNNSGALTVNYSEIEDLTRSGNLTIISNGMNELIIGESFSSDETLASLMNAYTMLQTFSDSTKNVIAQLMASPTYDLSDPVQAGVMASLNNDLATFSSDMTTLGLQIAQCEAEAPTSVETTITQLRMANCQIVWGVQSLYLGHRTLSRQLALTKSSYQLLKENVEALNLRYSMGQISELTFRSAEVQLSQLESAITSMENEVLSLEGQLNVMLGRDCDLPLKIAEMPKADRDFLKTVDQTKDLKSAKDNSYSLKIAKLNLDEFEKTAGNTNMANRQRTVLKNAVESERMNIELSYSTAVRTIKSKEQTLLSQETLLDLQKRTLESVKKKYELGMVSHLDLLQAEYDLFEQETSVASADADLFSAIEKYKWIVRGVSVS